MAHSQKIHSFLAKIETGGYGVDPTPTVADNAVRTDPLWSSFRPQWAWPNRRDNQATGTAITAIPGTPVGHYVDFEVGVELRGPGAAYGASSLPESDPLWQSILARADTFPTKVEYSPTASAQKSFTAYAYIAGPDNTKNHLYKVTGCRASSVRLPLNAGQLGMAVFSCSGLIVADLTEVAIPTLTYSAVIPPPVKASALTIGGAWTPNWQSGELVIAQNLQRLDSGNATDAIREFAAALPYAITLRLTAETVALATHNPYSIFKNSTSQALALSIGATQYNEVSITAAAMYLTGDPEPADMVNFTAWQEVYDLKDITVGWL